MLRIVRTGVARLTWLFDDLLALCLIIVTFVVVNAGGVPGGLDEFLAVRLTVRNLALGLAFMIVWHACFAACGLYRSTLRASLLVTSMRIVMACTAAALFLSCYTIASRSGAFTLSVVGYFWLTAVTVELVVRSVIRAGARYAEHHAREIKHAVIVGSGPRALQLHEDLRRRHLNDYVVLGFVDSRDPAAMPAAIRAQLLGSLEQFEHLLSTQPIDQVLIALPVKSQYAAIERVIEVCARVGVEAKYFPDLFAVGRARRAFDDEDELPGVRLQLVVDDHRLVVKRAIDLVAAISGLVVLSPLLLGCAVLVKLTSPGPVLFSQARYGRNRRLFFMYKFRTMVPDAEQLQGALESQNEARGPVFKIRADPRVTPVGRWMRRLSIDELPQLFNVVRGDMSLVGPRPLPVRDVSRFNETWLLRRFSVKPGLTCLWQVNGRSNVDFNDWVRLDLDYIDNWSLALDARILLKTVPVVLSGTGAM